MKKQRYPAKGRGALAAATAAAMLFCSAPAPAASYADFDAITSHVDLPILQELAITRPEEGALTAASHYYITGTSDPQAPLTLDGEPVEGRGALGSWGVWAALSPGENTFLFENGGAQQTLTILRSEQGPPPAKTDTLSALSPQYDVALPSGEKAVFTCIAPAGAEVAVRIAGETVPLRQKVAAAEEGVPATFTGEWELPQAEGTENLGQAEYLLRYGGQQTARLSPGELYAVGKGEQLLVELTDTASTIFRENSTSSSFMATAKAGAVDYVQEIEGDMYRLSMGGWVLQKNARPLDDISDYWNDVSSIRFERDEKGERFLFDGTGKPLFTAYQDASGLHLHFFHTAGIEEIPVEDSRLFSSAQVAEEGDGITLDFALIPGETLWGYGVEYPEEGGVILTCKYRPQLGPGPQPLSGVTVAIDAGHGGNDSGALGIAAGQGAVEKQITLATALAVEKRLQSLGAEVILTRREDAALSLSERQAVAQAAKADFFLSLHCNAPAAGTNGLKPNGIEVYYYEDISAGFAEELLGQMASATGRSARWSRYSNYKVTLNSYAPSVLLEMGFLQNPAEYDAMCSREGIFQTANAVAESILALLR